MAEAKKTPKKHNIVAAEGGSTTTHTIKDAKESGSATGLRIGAVLLWLVAIGLEVVCVLIFNGVITLTFIPTLAQLIIGLVLDLICVIIGSMLWKKSNRIDPASEKNKVKFWLWNNMGVIACVLAFVPFVILLLSSKEADAKTKKLASIVALVALVIGVIGSYDFDPISAEQKADAIAEYGDQTVYWAPFGKVYHTDESCSALNHTETLTAGTVEQAIEANRTRLCQKCEARDASKTADVPADDGGDAEE